MNSAELLDGIRRIVEDYDKKADERSMREIAAKDRLDISLERYMELINERDRLMNELANYERIFGDIKLPRDSNIIPGTVTIEQFHNVIDFTTKYRIEFKVNERRVKKNG